MRQVVVLLFIVASLVCAQDRSVRDINVQRKARYDSTAVPSTAPPGGKAFLYYRGSGLGWHYMTPDGVEHGVGSGGSGGIPDYPHDTSYVLRGDSAWAKIAQVALTNGGMLFAKGDTTIVVSSFVLASGSLDSAYIQTNDTTAFGYIPFDASIESIQYLSSGACNIDVKILYGSFGDWTASTTNGTTVSGKGITHITSLNGTAPTGATYFGILFTSITTRPRHLTWYVIGRMRF